MQRGAEAQKKAERNRWAERNKKGPRETKRAERGGEKKNEELKGRKLLPQINEYSASKKQLKETFENEGLLFHPRIGAEMDPQHP